GLDGLKNEPNSRQPRARLFAKRTGPSRLTRAFELKLLNTNTLLKEAHQEVRPSLLCRNGSLPRSSDSCETNSLLRRADDRRMPVMVIEKTKPNPTWQQNLLDFAKRTSQYPAIAVPVDAGI